MRHLALYKAKPKDQNTDPWLSFLILVKVKQVIIFRPANIWAFCVNNDVSRTTNILLWCYELSSWGRLYCLAVPDGILNNVCVEESHRVEIYILQTQQYTES